MNPGTDGRETHPYSRLKTYRRFMLPLSPVDLVPAVPVLVEPDAHGQAALLLAESLIHMLVEKRALTTAQAIEVIRIAAEVKMEVATAAGESDGRMRESLALLTKIEDSFEADRG